MNYFIINSNSRLIQITSMFSEKFYESDLTFLTTASKSTTQSLFELPKKTVTQKEMIIDILYMLLGMSCSILSKKNSSDQYQLTDKYQMSHLSTTTFKSAVKQSVKICNQTKYIETQTKKLYSASANAIVKTFCQAIFNYLQQTKQKYSQILSEINSISQPEHGKITLLNMSKILENGNYMSGFIIRCLNTCFIEQEMKIQVVRLLDKMWEIQQEMLSYVQFQRRELEEIFKKTLGRYFCVVKDWFGMKKIEDKVGFFILMEDSRKNISQYFLHRDQEIDPIKLPKLLENQSGGILQIGKTIRFISLYYEDHQQQKLMRYLNIEEQFRMLDQALRVQETVTFKRIKPERLSLNDRIRKRKKQKIADCEDKREDNPYEMFTKESKSFNIKWVEKRSSNILNQGTQQHMKNATQFGFLFNIKCTLIQILENINKKCLSFFRSTHDTLMPNKSNRIQTSLSNTLIGIKKFMLLEQGDFLQEFFNASVDIIDKQKKQISHNRIYSCIDEGIENSSAKNLPKQILNNVHFDFIKHADERSERLKLWVLFCFNYRQDNPINYIFNPAIMEKLKEVTNFIIKLKKGQLVLTRVWDEVRENKTRKLQPRVVKKQKVLRNSLNSFLNSIVSYTLVKIDILWQEYLQKISTASTVFEIVAQTKEVAQNLHKISIGDKLFFNGTMQTIMLVQKYRKLHLMIKDPTNIIPAREIDQLEFELKSVAEIVMKVGGLNQIVNYNSYFDQFE